jgi:hypothetical protein
MCTTVRDTDFASEENTAATDLSYDLPRNGGNYQPLKALRHRIAKTSMAAVAGV